MATEILNQPDRNEYVLAIDGEDVGFIDYQLRGDSIVFVHTEIDPAKRRAGLAGELVQGALDDVRTTSSLRVIAQCPFVRRWVDEHPEYEDFVDLV